MGKHKRSNFNQKKSNKNKQMILDSKNPYFKNLIGRFPQLFRQMKFKELPMEIQIKINKKKREKYWKGIPQIDEIQAKQKQNERINKMYDELGIDNTSIDPLGDLCDELEDQNTVPLTIDPLSGQLIFHNQNNLDIYDDFTSYKDLNFNQINDKIADRLAELNMEIEEFNADDDVYVCSSDFNNEFIVDMNMGENEYKSIDELEAAFKREGIVLDESDQLFNPDDNFQYDPTQYNIEFGMETENMMDDFYIDNNDSGDSGDIESEEDTNIDL